MPRNREEMENPLMDRHTKEKKKNVIQLRYCWYLKDKFYVCLFVYLFYLLTYLGSSNKVYCEKESYMKKV